ncbi:MAG: penicillin-binding protein 2 [Elusimicrobia bacterium]|nr:penicillin-binding protein 2 [Elusimicrobiota bacterium]
MAAPSRDALQSRLSVLSVFFYLGICVLAARLLQVQVVKNVYYSAAAERNRTQLIRQTAPRGRIFDRSGGEIAANQAVFSLIYLPSKERDSQSLPAVARDLAPYLKEDPEKLLENLYKAVREQSAIRLAEKLPSKAMFKLSELRTIYPGVLLIRESRRSYPNGAFAAHLMGHMGKMDEASWRRLKNQGYRVDSWVGRAGIEKIFEQDLRGQDGGMRMEVDARGRLRRTLGDIPPKPGSNITLTIDSRLQKVAEDVLRKSTSKAGAIVALDPRNGDVLVLASIPDFDPSWFLLPDEEDAPINLKNIPAFNLAIQGSFPPGSTFKIVSGAAILNEGKISPEERTFCPGYFELGSRVQLCWYHAGHKWQNFLQAVTNSCDVYFYKMGLKAGGDLIERYEKMFRIGQPTLIGLPGESKGHAFGPGTRAAQKRSWYDGDTINVSIGQGELLVTPIQMAVLMGAVANGGTFYRPHFVQKIQYADRPPFERVPEELGRVTLKDSTWTLLKSSLEDVVRVGTGGKVNTPGLVIGGKTGTAQNPGKDHAWFVGYAGKPGEAPSLALAVLVQFGGHGSDAATPVARDFIRAAFAPPVVETAVPAAPVAEQQPLPMRGPGAVPVLIH